MCGNEEYKDGGCCSVCGLQCILTAMTKDRLVDMLCHVNLSHVVSSRVRLGHVLLCIGYYIAWQAGRTQSSLMEPSCYRIAAKCANKQFEVHGSGEASAWQPPWCVAWRVSRQNGRIQPQQLQQIMLQHQAAKRLKNKQTIRPALKCHWCYWCYQAQVGHCFILLPKCKWELMNEPRDRMQDQETRWHQLGWWRLPKA